MFFLNQKTADVLGSSDWSSDLCSSDLVIEPESLICTCGGCLHCIGEDVSERLDVVPARFRVIITRRPKYACRSCGDGVRQAPAPAHLIEGGIPTEATIAHVLVSKYADHLPLYRQRSEEHTSELQSLMRISYAVFCLKKKKQQKCKQQL